MTEGKRNGLLRVVLLAGVVMMLAVLGTVGTADAAPKIPLDSADIEIRSGRVYTISNVEELYNFAQITNTGQNSCEGAVIELLADIAVNEGVFSHGETNEEYRTYPPLYNGGEITETTGLREWHAIGTKQAFKGTFEGNGHTISGLYCDYFYNGPVALFAQANSAVIQNVNVMNSYIRHSNVAAICGESYGSRIINCESDAILVGSFAAGGIVNRASAGSAANGAVPTVISDCTFRGEVLGGGVKGMSASSYSFDRIGGIAGIAGAVHMENCEVSGTVAGDKEIGALVGQAGDYVAAVNCVDKASVLDENGQHMLLGKGSLHEHSYRDAVVVTPATETAEGLAKKICSACSYAEEYILEKLPKLSYDVDLTNSFCGYVDEGNYGELHIGVYEGCVVDYILVNGMEVPVTKVLHYQDGDRIEVFFAKEGMTWEETSWQNRYAKTISGVEKTTIKASTQKSGGKIKVKWTKSPGYRVDYYEVYRSTSKSKVTAGEPFYKTKAGTAKSYTNSKSLKKGTRYYYKVRGVRVIGGVKCYTKWSNLVYRKA